jgi:phosphoserine phosphatase
VNDELSAEAGAIPDSPAPFDVVVFDCDSTLADLEGIDWLATDLSAATLAEIEALTRAAMGGELALEDVFGQRLARIGPTAAAMESLGKQYIATLLPGARLIVDILHFLGKEVHVVSGGLLPGVLALALDLGIPKQHVHAVGIEFDGDGNYAGFESSSPLARNGGKLEVLARIKRGRSVALIGDGLTDLEAAPECARFIAFGGVERREAVFSAAKVHLEERDLVALIPLLLSSDERRTLASTERFSDLF